MKESSWWAIALLLLIITGTIVAVLAIMSGRQELVEQMFGLLLAFSLGMASAEFARVRSAEKRTEAIEQDLLSEIEEILDDALSSDTGLLYSSTWMNIRSSGIPDRINRDLRKQLAEVFLALEIYNDDMRRFEDYSILPQAEKEVTKLLEACADESRGNLIEEAEKALSVAETMSKA